MISVASATADNHSTRVFNADTYPLPVLQFDASQEKVIVNRELSPVVEEDDSNENSKRTFMEGTASLTIPVGSIIYHSKEGITTVFDQTGKQILTADDSLAEMIQTPVGLIPATHVHTFPSGSYSYASENATYFVYNNTVIWVTIHERIDPPGNPEGNTSVTESSTSSGKTLNALSDAASLLNTPVIASAVVNNPGFTTGDSFTSEWTVPQSPSRTGTYSPAYLSLGLDELGTIKTNSKVYSNWQKVKPIIEYDYDQNAWYMTICHFDSFDSVNWEMASVDNWPINPGDKIKGRVEYEEKSDSTPSDPHYHIQSYIWNLNTGQRLSLGAGYHANTDTITKLNLILQGDLDKLDESSIVGGTTFSPVDFPASPTIYAATSNPQLPHLSVENLWPDKIIFHTLDAPEPEGYTFSMTNTISKYDQPSHFKDSEAELNNVSLWFSKNASWKLAFSNSDINVTKEDFGIHGGGLNKAVLHWHTGHGGYDSQNLDKSGLGIINTVKLEECKVNQSKDCNIIINGHSICENKRTTCAISDYTDILTPQEIAGKWNENNKWVVLSSCQVLQDVRWNNALGTTHGIFGFSTDSIADPSLSYQFFKYAMEDHLPLSEAWRNATIDVYNGRTVSVPLIPPPDGYSYYPVEVPIKAIVRFANESQYYNDHLPGYGTVEPDGNQNDVVKVDSWDCVKEV